MIIILIAFIGILIVILSHTYSYSITSSQYNKAIQLAKTYSDTGEIQIGAYKVYKNWVDYENGAYVIHFIEFYTVKAGFSLLHWSPILTFLDKSIFTSPYHLHDKKDIENIVILTATLNIINGAVKNFK